LYKIKSSKIVKNEETNKEKVPDTLKEVSSGKESKKEETETKENEIQPKVEMKKEDLPNHIVIKKRKALRAYHHDNSPPSPTKKQKTEQNE
jgi:hypothetical protein